MLFISRSLGQICLFECVLVKGGVKLMKLFKVGEGVQAIKVWELLFYTKVNLEEIHILYHV
jgi:hypothetical protein